MTPNPPTPTKRKRKPAKKPPTLAQRVADMERQIGTLLTLFRSLRLAHETHTHGRASW